MKAQKKKDEFWDSRMMDAPCICVQIKNQTTSQGPVFCMYVGRHKQMCLHNSTFMSKAHQSRASALDSLKKFFLIIFLKIKAPSSPIQLISGEKHSNSPSVLIVSSYWKHSISVMNECLLKCFRAQTSSHI